MSEIETDVVAHAPVQTDVRAGGVLWLVVAASVWGTVGVASALLNRVAPTPALVIGFLRLACAAPFLLTLASIVARRTGSRVRRADIPLLAAMGVAIALYQLFFFTAVPLAGVTLVTVVTLCSAPLIVAVVSVFVFAERPTRRVYIALALALPGIGVLVAGQEAGGTAFSSPIAGVGLALGSGFGYALFAILSKIATRRAIAGPHAMAVAFSLGALFLFPAALVGGPLRLDLPPGVWLIALYLGGVPTCLGYVFYARGLRDTPVTVATIVTMLEPAVAAVLAWLVLGEQVGIVALFGVALLIGSVLTLSLGKRG